MKTLPRRLYGCPLWLAAWAACSAPCLSVAATIGQQDDFQDLTTMAWGGNRYGTLDTIPTGGPGGAGDAFLQTSISGFHLGTVNTNQWAGDYLAAGIGAVEMDLNHLDPGTHRLTIRLLLFGPGGTFASRDLTPEVPTNTWTHYVFSLSADDLVYVTDGTGALNDTLADVTHLLVRHDRPTPTPPGRHPPHITATLGIDNVRAVPRLPGVGVLGLDGNQATLEFGELVAGVVYQIQGTDNLTQAPWIELGSFMASSESTNVTATIEGDMGFIRAGIP